MALIVVIVVKISEKIFRITAPIVAIVVIVDRVVKVDKENSTPSTSRSAATKGTI